MRKIAIILAGGVGERLWPLSRKNRPKQLLPLGADQPMIVQTLRRLLSIIPPEDIYIITSKNLTSMIEEVVADYLPSKNVLAEPAKRNTTGALVFALAFLRSHSGFDPESTLMGVFPADHYIYGEQEFQQTLNTVYRIVAEYPVIATIGIPPRYPATEYGYIEVDNSADSQDFFPVKQFREKPDSETAKTFVLSGNFYWNSGMFFWKVATIEQAINEHQPQIAGILENLVDALEQNQPEKTRKIFEQLPDISIDYAIMEKVQNIVMLPAPFQWNDIGSLASLADILPQNSSENTHWGSDIFSLESRQNIFWNDSQQTLVTYGLSDIVLIVLDDVVFACPREKAQNIREIVRFLKEKGLDNLL